MMLRKTAFGALVVIITIGVVGGIAWAVGGMGTPGDTSSDVAAEDLGKPERTFYVIAYHWGWAVFTEDGTRLDQIRLKQGTTVEIYAVNDWADAAINKLPPLVAQAIRSPDWVGRKAKPEGPIWPKMADHGFLIPWHGVSEYLDSDALEPVRVVFRADRPGEYEFVCTYFCYYSGHQAMTQRTMLVVE